MTGKRTELRRSSKPARQLWLPFEVKGELFASNSESGFPAMNMQLMEAVVEQGNLHAALKQVVRNGGGPGMDGMTVKELQRDWDRNFSEASYGFRPKRSAHQAVLQSQKHLKQGRRLHYRSDILQV